MKDRAEQHAMSVSREPALKGYGRGSKFFPASHFFGSDFLADLGQAEKDCVFSGQGATPDGGRSHGDSFLLVGLGWSGIDNQGGKLTLKRLVLEHQTGCLGAQTLQFLFEHSDSFVAVLFVQLGFGCDVTSAQEIRVRVDGSRPHDFAVEQAQEPDEDARGSESLDAESLLFLHVIHHSFQSIDGVMLPFHRSRSADRYGTCTSR